MNINDFKQDDTDLKIDQDMFSEIFAKQLSLEEKYNPIEKRNGALVPTIPLNVHTFEGQTRIRDLIHRITAEIYEADNCLRNKAWKTTHVQTDDAHFREELIDGFHFYVQLFIELGMTAEDVYNLYCKKNSVNQFRQRSNY